MRRVRVVVALVVVVAALLVGAVATGPTGPTRSSGSGPGSAPAVTPPSPKAPPPGPPFRSLDTRPNVVVIMADDMRADELEWMPETRALLAGDGASFDNAFAPYPLCCPSRASFLTGQYAQNHHVWSNRDPYGFSALRDSQTLPVWLQQAGYNTGMVGKYLNGYGSRPTHASEESSHYVPPGWTDWRGSIENHGGSGGTYRYFNLALNENGSVVENPGHYSTRLVGQQSRDILAGFAGSSKPFFLWSSYIAPHTGRPVEPDDPENYQPPGGDRVIDWPTPARPKKLRGRLDGVLTAPPGPVGEADVSDKPFFINRLPPVDPTMRAGITEIAQQRAESLIALDKQVAATLGTLARLGHLDDTIVVFVSDNGFFLGEHRRLFGKILYYEPVLRVPILMRGPGIPAGVHRTDPGLIIDLAPTILDAASASAGIAEDGQSLLPVARHGDRGWKRGIVTDSGPRVQAFDPKVDMTPAKNHGPPSGLRYSEGLRTPRYLYVEHFDQERELYDLRRDPDELHSIVDDPASARLVARLSSILHRLRSCSGSACRTPLPEDLRARAGFGSLGATPTSRLEGLSNPLAP